MSVIKTFAISAATTAGAGEIFSTQITGTDNVDILLKIILPLVSGFVTSIVAPAVTKLVDAWAYKIKNSVKNKQLKKQNDANEKSKNEKEEDSKS